MWPSCPLLPSSSVLLVDKSFYSPAAHLPQCLSICVSPPIACPTTALCPSLPRRCFKVFHSFLAKPLLRWIALHPLRLSPALTSSLDMFGAGDRWDPTRCPLTGNAIVCSLCLLRSTESVKLVCKSVDPCKNVKWQRPSNLRRLWLHPRPKADSRHSMLAENAPRDWALHPRHSSAGRLQ